MTKSANRRRFYNFIWILVLAVILTLSMPGRENLTAVALEQEVRCGQVEHTHTQECYMNDILLCKHKAHIHSEDCYLLRLEDNDINWLLLTVDRSQDKSLESVLDSAMVQTLVLNENLQATLPETLQPTNPTTAPTTAATTAPTTEPPVPAATTQPTQPTTTTPTVPKETTAPTEPTIPEETTVPTEPTVPENTTTPTEPTIPEDTTTPTEPTVPEDTTTPTEPTVPEDTTTPTEPTVPEDTTTPTEPTIPEDTTTPTEPTIPEDTTAPTEPTVPEDTTTPTEPTVPEDTTAPTEPTVPEDTTAPTEPTVPEDTTTPTEPTVPEDTTAPTEPTVPEDTTTPTEPTVPEDTTTPTEPTIPEDTTAPTEPTEPEETTTPTDPTVPKEPEDKGPLLTSPAPRATPEVPPVTDGPYANFYVWLDDARFVCIGQTVITDAGSADYSLKRDVVALFNSNGVASNVTESELEPNPYDAAGVHIRYGTTQPSEATTTISSFYYDANRFYNYGTGKAEHDKVGFMDAVTADKYNKRFALLALTDDTFTYTPISFYTVTLDYAAADGANQVQYVQSGVDSTLELSGDYLWTTDPEGNNPITGTELQNITAPVTLYAHPAAPKEVTVTFEGAGEIQPIVTTTGAVTLPDLTNTEYSGMIWVEKDSTDGTWYAADGTTNAPVTQDTTFVAVPAQYTITFVDANGNTVPVTVPYYGTVNFTESAPTLPNGYYWVDEDGQIYDGNGVFTPVVKDQTFTAATKPITIVYDMDFPTTNELRDRKLKPKDDAPTLLGDAMVTVLAGTRTTIHNVSDQNVDLTLSNATNRYAVAHFVGWETKTGTIIDPNSRLSHSALSALDTDGDGIVNLTGKWVYEPILSVNFFVRYSVGDNVSSNSSTNYTDVVFTTYVGGLDSINVNNYSNDTLNKQYAFGKTDGVEYNATQFYEYDQQVRALYGEKETGVWLPEFPDDADMLEVLANINADKTLYAVESGTGDLVAVNRDELNTDNYAIRWYMFKAAGEGYDRENTWHIDGLLVKKQGKITINKDFAGDEAAILAAENGNFSVTARNGTIENGVFTPFTNDKARSHTLRLADAVKNGAHSYQWVIDAVSLGEYWKIEETAQTVTLDGKEYIYYTEYSIYDSDGNITEVAEYGTKAYVVGKTYALDIDPDQGMTVEFKNFYYPEDTLLIKKEDADTGKPLGGAAFELWQYNTNGIPVQLKFSYKADTGQYEFDSDNGTVTTISTGTSGYANVALSGFSYEHGTVILKEVTAPSGYDPAPWIEISEQDGQVQLSDVYHSGEDKIPHSDWNKHAEVNEDGHVLVVKDHNSEYVTVNVQKRWDPVDAVQDSITVVLQANGVRATNVFPTISNAEVTIDAADGWKYSWTNLPAFANGEPVQWSVKEIAIGAETLVAGSDRFANWISTVVLTSRKDTNNSGLDDEWNYLVTNTHRRTQIILTKTDETGKSLPDATFELVEVEHKNGTWQPVSGAPVMSETTNEHGILTFDGLTAGAKYRLTETRAPNGYLAELDSVIITVNGEGLIQKVEDDGTYVSVTGGALTYTGAYNIQVVNTALEPLPETGGMGITVYTQSGLLLLAAGTALLIYQKRKRCRRGVSPDA